MKIFGLVLVASTLIVGCIAERASHPSTPQTSTCMSAAPTERKAVSRDAIAMLRLGMTPQEVEGVLGPGLVLSLPAYDYPAQEGGSYWVAFFQVDPESPVDGTPLGSEALTAVIHSPKDDGTPRYILPASRTGKPFVPQGMEQPTNHPTP